ncbi:alpha/beta hydrolase [Hymenobacter ginsengisoli]|uniref:Alpha/beta hydrolase n=1 Tax=Hymenobacter ginsengisoli TaxID=1051626 RepID=A0ABP8PUS3_9BACT|nr:MULTISPECIES: alpha/beta hydrolase [unclassified Hymenobacter]MBO2033743.1 alpha/beta hydrolase [Hymenobacter sp. BT559]
MTANHPEAVIRHSITAADQAAITAMRLATAPMKGKINGPAARLPFADIMRHTPAAPGVTYEEARVGGVAGWWCRPEASAPTDSVVLFLHGGGYVLGSAEAHRNFVSQLVARVGVDFFVPDYRLAPEHPFPAAIEDVLAAYRGLGALGKRRIALAGDSAGGGLALVTAALATDEAAAVRPCAALVFSPWTDLTLASASFQTRAEADPIFTKDALGSLARHYLQGYDGHDARVSPVYGKLAGLPPVQVHVGDAEVLLDDSVRYVALAQAAGVPAELHEWEGLPHVFASNLDGFQAASKALDLGGAFLAAQLA